MVISQREKRMVLIAVLFIITALIYKFAFVPLKDQWFHMDQQIEQLSKKVERAKYLKAHPTIGLYANNTVENQTITTAGFLEKAESWAAESNIKVTSIRPGSVINKGSISELSFEIELSGNLSGIAHFIKSVEAPETVARINKLRISRVGEEEGAEINVQLNISVLCLSEPQKTNKKKTLATGAVE